MVSNKRGEAVVVSLALLLVIGCTDLRRMESPASDNEADRRSAAERYLAVSPTRVQIENLATLLADSAPSNQQDIIRRRLLGGIRNDVLEKATLNALVHNFTASEIDALAAFYATPAGRTVVRKLPRYSAELMGPVEEELARAMAPTNNTPGAALQWGARVREVDVGLHARKVPFSFSFTNRATRPVSVLSVTSPELAFDVMAGTNFTPGQVGRIAGTLEIGDRRGEHAVMIGVTTDDRVEPAMELMFVVKVPDPLWVTPSFLRWETGDKPDARTTTVIRATTNHTVQILGVESTNPVFQTRWERGSQSATNTLLVTPRSTAQPANGEIRIHARLDGRYDRVFHVFTHVAGTKAVRKAPTPMWGGEVLWIDARTRREYEKGHLPGAMLLNQVEWDSLVEPVLRAWRPGVPVVVYCAKGCRASGVVQRLWDYGMADVFFLVRAY